MIPGRPPKGLSADAEEGPLNIASATVSYLIERTREAYADMPPPDDAEEDISEHRSFEADLSELGEFIDELNEDERIDLVVLMWIGRGTYGVDELDRARDTARREATHTASEYLLSTPLVGDYLADGLEAFGLSMEES